MKREEILEKKLFQLWNCIKSLHRCRRRLHSRKKRRKNLRNWCDVKWLTWKWFSEKRRKNTESTQKWNEKQIRFYEHPTSFWRVEKRMEDSWMDDLMLGTFETTRYDIINWGMTRTMVGPFSTWKRWSWFQLRTLSTDFNLMDLINKPRRHPISLARILKKRVWSDFNPKSLFLSFWINVVVVTELFGSNYFKIILRLQSRSRRFREQILHAFIRLLRRKLPFYNPPQPLDSYASNSQISLLKGNNLVAINYQKTFSNKTKLIK